MTRIKEVLSFMNGNMAVFDEAGQQIPELQISNYALWAEHAAARGYDPEGVSFENRGLLTHDPVLGWRLVTRHEYYNLHKEGNYKGPDPTSV